MEDSNSLAEDVLAGMLQEEATHNNADNMETDQEEGNIYRRTILPHFFGDQ